MMRSALKASICRDARVECGAARSVSAWLRSAVVVAS
jgi:hypothetical protein